jgi:hypothetical protein
VWWLTKRGRLAAVQPQRGGALADKVQHRWVRELCLASGCSRTYSWRRNGGRVSQRWRGGQRKKPEGGRRVLPAALVRER